MSSKNNTVMAFDFGMRRIGCAVGQRVTATANPVSQIAAQDGIPNWDIIEQLIAEWQPEQLIVGLPLTLEGQMQAVTYSAKRFAGRLKHRFKLPVDMMDERMTTREARHWAKLQGYDASEPIDAIAAAIILEAWFRTH